MKKQLSLFYQCLRQSGFIKCFHLGILLFMYFGFTYLVNAQTKIWKKKFGGPSYGILRATIKTADGGYLMGGSSEAGKGEDKSEASRGGYDLWIVKLDSQGNKQWDKTYGGNKEDRLGDIIATPDGGYLLGGISNSDKGGEKSETNKGSADFWIVKIDAQGKKLWDKTYGGNKSDGIAKMAIAPDGGYLLAGNSDSDKSGDKSEDLKDTKESEFGPWDFWVVKIDEKGAKLWDKTYGSEYRDRLTSLVVSPNGGYLLGGDGGYTDCANRIARAFGS